jgi:uncharacterized ParB-like nuclease family protein
MQQGAKSIMSELLKLAAIRIDGNTQLRAETNQDTVDGYAQDMLAGDVFPPVVVYHDGTDYWLSDGFHRYHAVEQVGKDEIDVEVRQGTRRDAQLNAAAANRKHGLQFTNADKRRIVTIFLSDAEWSKWSDREIARQCGVSQPFVSKMREALTDNRYQSTDQSTQEKVETAIAEYGRKKSVAAWWKTVEENAPESRVETIRYYAQVHDRLLTMRNEAAEAALREDRRIGQLLNEMQKNETPRPLDLDTEAQEIRAILALGNVDENPIIAAVVGKKLSRIKHYFDVTGLIDSKRSSFVEDALEMSGILREIQSILTPEQFTLWLRAKNALNYDGDEVYTQSLLSVTQPYTRETPVDAIDLDNQRIIAIAWYNWAVSSKEFPGQFPLRMKDPQQWFGWSEESAEAQA